MLRTLSIFFCLWLSLAYGDVYIAEFMASNNGAVLDEDGEASDWLELYNAGSTTVSLNGLFLTDSTNSLTKWALPAIDLASDASIVIFASGKNQRDPGSELHTNFKLDAAGEFLGLIDADGQTALHAYAPTFPQQFADVSYGLGSVRMDTPLLETNALVRSFVPTNSLLSNLWTRLDFDDSSWSSGLQGVGYDRSGAYPGLIQHNLESTLYNQQLNALLRMPFVLTNTANLDALHLEAQVDDGFALWLNEEEILRDNLAGQELGGNRVMSYEATTGAGGGVIDLQSVTLSRGGFQYTYATNELIGITLTQFAGSSGSNLTLPTGQPVPDAGERHRLLDDDYNLNTGVINPGSSPSPLTSDPTPSTPGFAIIFDQPVSNRAGDDVVFFELQNSSNPPGGDVVHVSPLTGVGVNGLQSITIDTYDIPFSTAYPLDGFTLYRASTTPGSLSELESLDYVSPSNLSGFRALAVGIDLSELGYAPGVAVSGLFFQAGDSGSTVDPVFIAGLPAPPSDAPFVHDIPANQERSPAEVIQGKIFDLQAYKDRLFVGTNILAVQVANARIDDDELLFRARLLAGDEQLDAASQQYFVQPSPGALNPVGASLPGPIITRVTDAPLVSTNDLPITARIRPSQFAIDQVEMVYRVMFGAEVTRPMSATGETYQATIPASAYEAGEMVRWYIRAHDVEGTTTRFPPFADPTGSPEYLGTVVATNIASDLEILHRFVEQASLAETDPGTRCSLWFNGAFYDNINIRIRGRGSRGWPKKSYKLDFNDGYNFRWHPDHPRTDEINLNSSYSDPSYLRNLLSFETWKHAGANAPEIRHIRVHQNGAFWNVAVMIEQVQRDFLRRVGLSDEGALYKMDTNNLQSPTSGVEKRNRKGEDNSDLAALIDGLALTGTAGKNYIFDQINLPHEMCYLGGIVLNQHVSGTIRNYYMYRDTAGSGEWQSLPWDPDISYGYFFSTGLTYHHATDGPNPISHPFIAGFDHPITYSSLVDVVLPFRAVLYENPRTRQMFLRRLRTLMDTFLQEEAQVLPDERHYERRIAELVSLLDADTALDRATWGGNNNTGAEIPIATAAQQLLDNYLSPRRDHLFVTHSIHNAAYTNSVLIPDAQPANAALQFGSVEFNPGSGDQDQEYIELINTNDYAVDLSGWVITGGVEHVMKPGTVIPAFNAANALDHTLYLSPDVVAFRARTNSPAGGEGRFVQGSYNGHLSSFGETLILRNDQGIEVDRLSYPGNPSRQQTDLVISEVMYHPEHSEDTEFIELLNVGTNTLSLSNVLFSSGIDFVFTNTLAPGSVTLLVRNRAAFEAAYGLGLPIAGEYQDAASAFLDNNGEQLKLDDPSNSTIKDFTYRDVFPWPAAADGLGPSLSLIDPHSNPDPAEAFNWRSSLRIGGTPGEVFVSAREEWVDLHFTVGEQSNPAVSGWDADPDGDGRNNDQEFLFGGHPRQVGPVRSMQIARDQSLTVYRRADSPEVSYRLEFSTDLVDWSSAESFFNMTLGAVDVQGIQSIVRRPFLPLDGPRYFRQRAEYSFP